MDFIHVDNAHFWIGIVLSLMNATLMCFAGFKCLHILQLSGYKLKGYKEWLKDTKARYISRLAMLSFLSLACMLVTNALFDAYSTFFAYLGLIFYFYFTIVFIVNMYSIPSKKPFVQTRRVTRLICVLFIVVASVTFALISICTEWLPYIKFGVVALLPITLPILVPLAHLISCPVEAVIRKHYLYRAKKKISKFPSLIRIGITGSYGKTSTKYILNRILSEKYNVCMSPHSFNTPMGLSKVILKYLEEGDEILISEMGARNVGDIAELCQIIKPRYGIITSVGTQHLASFCTVENIKKTKNELSLACEDLVVFCGDNSGAMELYAEREKEKLYTSISDKNAYCYADEISVNENGSCFTLNINGSKILCKTKLLGSHNISNILTCAALAYKLKVPLKRIAIAIADLEPIPHRLEISKVNGITIIDNTYNSSVQASKASIEVLSLFKGKKVVITPGLVELGVKEHEYNVQFGQDLAKVADKVVIVNSVNKESITRGLIEGDFNANNIICIDKMSAKLLQEKGLIEKGDIVLFENDLPDNYT